jgi:hypothetical protein
MERMWEEVVMTYFKVIIRIFLEEVKISIGVFGIPAEIDWFLDDLMTPFQQLNLYDVE